MSWRQAVEVEFAGWPASERSRAMQEIAEENDHAERLGFTCHLDDRRGFGKCYFINGNRRVWQTADGWVGSTCTGPVGFYGARDLFHTLDQALRNVNPFAHVNRFGRREG